MTYAKIGQHFAPHEIDSKFVTSVKQLREFDTRVMDFIKDQLTPCVLMRIESRWKILSLSPLNTLHGKYMEIQDTMIDSDTLIYWL